MSKAQREAQLRKIVEQLKARIRGEEKPAEIIFEDTGEAAIRAQESVQAAKADSARKGKAMWCPNCGLLLAYRDTRKRTVVSDEGDTTIERGYCCRSCQHRFFLPA